MLKNFSNKVAPYCILSVIFLAVSIALSLLFDFSLTNTWQAFVALVFVFGPLWICGWKQTKKHKGKHPFGCFCGRFCLVLIALGYLLTVIAFLTGQI